MLDGVTTVFHLAGKAHAFAPDYRDEAAYFSVNVAATRRLLEAARDAGVKRFVYFSSVKASGFPVEGDTDMVVDEQHQHAPESSYGCSKRMAEKLVLDGGFVPEPVVIRPSMVYGNTEKGNLPKMIRAIRNHRFPPLPDSGNRRSMVHVEDIVRAALLVAEHPDAIGKIYIVTDDERYSTWQIQSWIHEVLGQPLPQRHVPLSWLRFLACCGDLIGKLRGRRFLFDGEVLRRLIDSECYSSARIEQELGFQPRRNLRESLPEMVQYLDRIPVE